MEEKLKRFREGLTERLKQQRDKKIEEEKKKEQEELIKKQKLSQVCVYVVLYVRPCM